MNEKRQIHKPNKFIVSIVLALIQGAGVGRPTP